MSDEKHPILMYCVLPDTPTANVARMLAHETDWQMRLAGVTRDTHHVDVEWLPREDDWAGPELGCYRLELRRNDDPRYRPTPEQLAEWREAGP